MNGNQNKLKRTVLQDVESTGLESGTGKHTVTTALGSEMQKELQTIEDFYGNKVAQRSQVKLIKHIYEGLRILDALGSDTRTKAAYCLHPIVQNSEPIDVSWSPAYELALEYRDRANSYLCRPCTDHINTVEQLVATVGKMSEECRQMLVADKRQNYSDFVLYHYSKHERSEQLTKYFGLWITALEQDAFR